MIWENFLSNIQINSMESILTALIIFSLSFFFSMQIFAWITPPRPKFVHALALGSLAGAGFFFIVYAQIPLAPALIRAGINGVYGYPGYFWVGSLLWINAVFILNTVNSWTQNKPLEVIQ